jgi:integrase/recombinase XerC
MFIEAAYNFLNHLKAAKNASEHTIRNYAIDLNSLKAYLEVDLKLDPNYLPSKIDYARPYSERFTGNDNGLNLSQIDRRTIRGFLAHLNQNDANKRTIVRRLSSLRTFFKYAYTQKLIPSNPTEEIESPKLEKKLPVSLSYDQVLRLFEQPDVTSYLGFRDRTIMELFYSSGLRVSELAGLNRSDFDLSNRLLKLRGKGK